MEVGRASFSCTVYIFYWAILSKYNCSPTSSLETPSLMERFFLFLSLILPPHKQQTSFLFPLNKNQTSTPISLFWVPPTLPQNLAFPIQQSSNLKFQCMGKQKGIHFRKKKSLVLCLVLDQRVQFFIIILQHATLLFLLV